MGRCTPIEKDFCVNEEIREKEVRLVDADGSQVGVVSTKEALKLANERNLDLVNIAPKAVPPVCKIMDFGKYRFEVIKKQKEAKKNQKIVSIKEIRISPTIEDHDFNVKVKQLLKFIQDGDKVKITVKFRGREMNNVSAGSELLKKFVEVLGTEGNVEKEAKLEGKNMSMIVSPK